MQKLAQLNEATHHWINRVETKHKQINFTWWTSWTSTLWVHFGRKRLTTRCSVWQLGGTGPNFKEFELDAALDWIVGKLELLARQWGLDLNFGSFFFFFLVQSQIAIWSLKPIRHLWMCTAHGIYRSCHREKLARIPWFLGRWNHIQTNTPFEVDQH